MNEKYEEVNYKKNFCEKYFDKGTWDLDVLNRVDVLLKDKNGNFLLYIESKYKITNQSEHRKALAQVILTNKKQTSILSRVALIFQDTDNNDILEFIDCSENSIMFNNDFNWGAEKANNPSKDAIDRINDRIQGKITRYENDEIKEFYKNLKSGSDVEIKITEKNFNIVYNQWKQEVLFTKEIKDEQDLINLFLVDILNGTKYKKSFYSDIEENTLFGAVKTGVKENETEQDLIREGTNLSHYEITHINEKIRILYEYEEKGKSDIYTIADSKKYAFFWKKYKRPPEKNEFLKILERSATLYSDKYRRDTGGEYTPTCFVEKQNEILAKYYDINDFIVCDPCAGVGNLENQFGKEFKQYCYLSTLEQMDVDICKIKGFDNAIQFDYLATKEQPKWKYKGTALDINEICRRENRKLMIVMNPPYQKKKSHKYNLAIEFFNKVLELKPDVIVFYYETNSFFRSEVNQYINSGYKIRSHIFSNAKTTFNLSEWAISQVIFDKNNGDEIIKNNISASRYEIENKNFTFIKNYSYNLREENLFKDLKNTIKNNSKGLILGNVSYLNDVIKIGNGGINRGNNVTVQNLKYCLLSKGLIFNTHHKYFELNSIVYQGTVKEINTELFNDSIIFSLFYKGILFTNKGQKNYIMPFTAEELGCAKNDLNVLFAEDIKDSFFKKEDFAENEPPFDFREFLSQFTFSTEAKALYSAALEVFKYYHKCDEYQNKDWNDSFYDITNVIMGKDPTDDFRKKDKQNKYSLEQHRTTKGTKGFGRNTIKYVVASEFLPIFTRFFDARDVLARKINKQLVDSGLLLWERENIY